MSTELPPVMNSGSADPATHNPSDWTVVKGTSPDSNLLTVSSGATYNWGDGALYDAMEIDRFSADGEKAASRHARHEQEARKAVAGASALLGPSVAASIATHTTALIGDVTKHKSLLAGALKLAGRFADQLREERRKNAAARKQADEVVGVIRSAMGREWPMAATGGNLGAAFEAAYGIAAAYGERVHNNRTVEEHLPVLLSRPTTVEHDALHARVMFLEGRIEAAINSGLLRTSTGRGWLRRGAEVETEHIRDRQTNYQQVWQRHWDDHRNRTAETLTPLGSLGSLQIPMAGSNPPPSAG